MKDFIRSQKVPPNRTAAVIAKKEVICIESNALLTEAAQLMREKHIGDLVVIEKHGNISKPIGMITDRDILIETLPQQVEPKILYVSDIMSRTVATARESEDVFSMAETMKNCGISRLPIVDEKGGLCGIVTAKSLFKLLSKSLSDLAGISKQQQKNEKEVRH